MAGGSGERFWPLSRNAKPKQLLCLAGETETMLAETVSSIARVIPTDDIYIVTGKHLLNVIRDARVGVPDENVIAEPCKRNTTGCLAYTTAHLLAKYGDEAAQIAMAVTSADYRIGDADRLCRVIEAALACAEREPVLTTVGVVPTGPETGYGYIQVREDVRRPPQGRDEIPIYPIIAFREKPSREQAEDFIATGRYFWNTGMFFWRISTFLVALDAVRPELTHAIRRMTEALRGGYLGLVDGIFEGIEDVSIDYALMEHSKNVRVVRADFPWDHVGAWPALDSTRQRDPKGNVLVGEPLAIDCEDTIVYNAVGPEQMAVAVIGAEDLIVVVTDDAVLVARKDRAQDVRRVVRMLRDRNSRHI